MEGSSSTIKTWIGPGAIGVAGYFLQVPPPAYRTKVLCPPLRSVCRFHSGALAALLARFAVAPRGSHCAKSIARRVLGHPNTPASHPACPIDGIDSAIPSKSVGRSQNLEDLAESELTNRTSCAS